MGLVAFISGIFTQPVGIPRSLAIADRRVSIPNAIASLGIKLVFAIVFSLVLWGGYFSQSEIEGRSSVTVGNGTQPTVFASLSMANLSYCNESVQGPQSQQRSAQLPCLWFDIPAVVYPEAEDEAVTITTRVSARNETCTPSPIQLCTNALDAGVEQRFFVADPSRYTIRILHSARTPVLYEGALQSADYDAQTVVASTLFVNAQGVNESIGDIAASAITTYGVVFFQNGTVYRHYYPTDDYSTRDLTIGEILMLANVDLDGPAYDNTHATLRNSGINIQCTIYYSNLRVQDLGRGQTIRPSLYPSLHFEMRFSQLTTLDARQVETVFYSPTSRTVLSRRGIHIVFMVTGVAYRFDFMKLMDPLNSANTFLAILGSVVTFILLGLCPQRGHYARKITEDCKSELVPQDELMPVGPDFLVPLWQRICCCGCAKRRMPTADEQATKQLETPLMAVSTYDPPTQIVSES
eukprot:TRINITY_DN3191_c0_g1_i1.p1 TRINITY_DN3191_c0_g1~~TRINITY_DN3191_c0_g1_i1.p1  ORF type:complete len:466 (-),score=65.09 TRINITY_DN3191_c0_g1_i1:69-1466(-)